MVKPPSVQWPGTSAPQCEAHVLVWVVVKGNVVSDSKSLANKVHAARQVKIVILTEIDYVRVVIAAVDDLGYCILEGFAVAQVSFLK